jgi:DNA-binding response OmpR family regulator
MKKRVLLIEDDRKLAESVMHFLELNDTYCDYCCDGRQAITLVAANVYDVIVSDVNMPVMDGLSLCKALRELGCELPILLLTANDDIEDKLQGFASGADDYLTKPFQLRELTARINALAFRSSGKSKRLRIDELKLELQLNQHRAFRENIELNLSPSSWTILEKLTRAYPDAVSKNELEFAVWGEQLPDSNALKVHVHRLRNKLDKPFSHNILQARNGFGFQLRQA